MRYYIYTFLFLIAILLNSCGYDQMIEDSPRNLYGDPGRTSNYEDYGEFYSAFHAAYDMKGDDTTGALQAPLVVRSYEIVAATSGGSIIVLNDSGVMLTFRLDSNELVASAMCADPQENIYALTNMGNLYKIGLDGHLFFKKNLFPNEDFSHVFSDLLTTGDAIYAADREGLLVKLDTLGQIIWQREFASAIGETFAADDRGRIILPLVSGGFQGEDTLLVLDNDGVRQAERAFPGRIINSPVAQRGRIYISVEQEIRGNRLSKIYCLDADLNTIWDKELAVMPRYLSVSDAYEVYATGYNAGIGQPMSGLYAFDSTGTLLWKIYAKAAIPAPLIITETQIIASGITENGPVAFFFKRKTGVMIKQMSLANVPALYPVPAATPDRKVIFLGSGELKLVTIDDTQINKLLPY